MRQLGPRPGVNWPCSCLGSFRLTTVTPGPHLHRVSPGSEPEMANTVATRPIILATFGGFPTGPSCPPLFTGESKTMGETNEDGDGVNDDGVANEMEM